MTLSKQEIDWLVAGLDLLARQQKDVLAAASELLPLREKLNAEVRRLQEATDGTKP